MPLALVAAGPAGTGDPARGAAIALRQSSTCVLCHKLPGGDPHLQGDVGPDLHGVGARRSLAELQAQIENPRAANPASVMPAFGRIEGLHRVGAAWLGQPILSAAEIADVASYLASLR